MFDEILQWFSSHLSNLTDALVYCAIAGVTLIGVFKCLIPLITTTHALRRAITRLQQDAGTRQGTPVWQEKRFMGNRLKNCWLRFLQNAEQLDRRGLPCNVEDYINDDTVIHGPGNAQLADLIPGLLTSLGILGTFMGMMDGLGGLDFSNADKIIEGIPTLLTGMQFAFGTSVAGVSCSICFNIINRILQGSSYRAIDDFVSNFTSLAMSRPLDNDVQLICQNQSVGTGNRITAVHHTDDFSAGGTSLFAQSAHLMEFQLFAIYKHIGTGCRNQTTDMIIDAFYISPEINMLLFLLNGVGKRCFRFVLFHEDSTSVNDFRNAFTQQLCTGNGQLIIQGPHRILIFNRHMTLRHDSTGIHFLHHAHDGYTAFRMPFDDCLMNRCPASQLWQQRCMHID